MSRKFCNAVNCTWKSLALEMINGLWKCINTSGQTNVFKCDYITQKGYIRKNPIANRTKIENIQSLKTLAAYLRYIK